MSRLSVKNKADSWSDYNSHWRETEKVVTYWKDAGNIDKRSLEFKVSGDWWDILDDNNLTLLLSREYEHLLIALSVKSKPFITYMNIPHPSGMAIDHEKGKVYVASTRNPNQLFEMSPVSATLNRSDVKTINFDYKPLLPVKATFMPGCLYIHDLALIKNKIYANAVGWNAIIEIDQNGTFTPVWWPICIEKNGKPDFERNYIQLNCIATGENIEKSFFSASAEKISSRRPGHLNFPVNKKGVIFDGISRQPIVRGLTRPHSARLHDNRLWLDNSGYGEFGVIDSDNMFQTVSKLPGWTRGLCFYKNLAFVGTSRVIPRFKNYAPGLDVDKSHCGIHAVDITTGKTVGSIMWPNGNQIFSVEWISNRVTSGFAYTRNKSVEKIKNLFYCYHLEKK